MELLAFIGVSYILYLIIRLLGITERNYELSEDYNFKISITRRIFHYISIFIILLCFLTILPGIFLLIEITLNNKLKTIDELNDELSKKQIKNL